MNNWTLSLLDQSPVIDGSSPAEAIAATLDLVQAADALGYKRYWFAEHHGLAGVCISAPELMIARAGALTKRIRLGSGGVMLPHYSAFHVAEQFRMLELFYPGRIDLGIGRAPGSDRRTANLVSNGTYDPEAFGQQAADLAEIVRGSTAPSHPAFNVAVQPAGGSQPELWMLGSSHYGGSAAAWLGYRYAFAHFIHPEGGEVVAATYREKFRSGAHDESYLAVAVFAVCTNSPSETAAVEAAVDLRRVEMAYGLNTSIPNIARGAGWKPDAEARALAAGERPRSLIGHVDDVALKIEQIQERFGADEVILLSIAPEYELRTRTAEQLALAFGLPGLDLKS